MDELKKYVSQYPGGVAAFAKKVGVSPAAIYHYMTGFRHPRPKIALRIEQKTGGSVKKESLLWPS